MRQVMWPRDIEIVREKEVWEATEREKRGKLRGHKSFQRD